MPLRKIWTQYEDKILKELKLNHKILKWSQIVKIMEEQYQIKGRTAKQCRQRFENHLKQGIEKRPWFELEQSRLIQLHLENGNKWVCIANQLKNLNFNRTGNSVKNYFMSLMKRSFRNLNKQLVFIKKPNIRKIQLSFITKLLNIFLQILNNQQEQDSDKLRLCRQIEVSVLDFRNMQIPTMQMAEQSERVYNLIRELKRKTCRRRKWYEQKNKPDNQFPLQQFKDGIKDEELSQKQQQCQQQIHKKQTRYDSIFIEEQIKKEQIWNSQQDFLDIGDVLQNQYENLC